jgi:hypothetical protein
MKKTAIAKKMTAIERETRGCERCRTSPETIVRVREIFDSSHSSFTLCRCSVCDQTYLEQFHEIVNWEGGGDDVYVYWTPLTKREAAQVSTRWTWNQLAELMHRRGRLVREQGERVYWSDYPYSTGDMMPPG